MKRRDFFLYALVLFVLGTVAGITQEVIRQNQLIFGTPSGDKEIIVEEGQGANNPRLKFNETDQKWQFSNDGSNFKAIGSGAGAGSGTNLLATEDSDFESGVGSWSAATTAPTSVSQDADSEPQFGLKALSWDAVGADTLDSALVEVGVGLKGKTCEFEFWYSWPGTLGDLEVELLDSGGNVLSETDRELLPTDSGQWLKDFVTGPCPANASDTVRARFTATANAAALLLDNARLGDFVSVEVAQAREVGTLTYPTTANCIWGTTAADFSDFTVDADCSNPIVTGDLQQHSGGKIPGFNIPNAAAGKYLVIMQGLLSRGGSDETCEFQLHDDSSGNAYALVDSGADKSNDLVGSFEHSGGNLEVEIQGHKIGGTNDCTVNASLENRVLEFKVFFNPAESQTARRFDKENWFVDVNIGGANPSLGTSDISTYTGITDPGLDLVVNDGSIGAEIACSGTEESSGLTCTGDESVGVSFDLPKAGPVLGCFAFSHNGAADAAGTVGVTFQVVETGNADQNIGKEGNERIFSAPDGSTGTAMNSTIPNRVCGLFNFTSSGKKTIRLFREQVTAATVSINSILAERSTSSGQRDIRFLAMPISQNSSLNLINSIVSDYPGILKRCDARIDGSSGTPDIDLEIGDCLDDSSLVDSGQGSYTVDFTKSFSSEPICKATCLSAQRVCNLSTVSSSGFQTDIRTNQTTDTGSPIDSIVSISCIGPR